MFGFIKRKCTAETLGTIVKKRWMAIYGLLQSSISWKDNHISSKSSSLIMLRKNIKLERFQSECILHRHLRVLTLMPASVLSTIRINLSRAICRITMDFIWDRDGV